MMQNNKLINFILDSKYLKNKLDIYEYSELIEMIQTDQFPKDKLEQLNEFFRLKTKTKENLKILARIGLVASALVVPGGGILFTLVNKITQSYSMECFKKCGDIKTKTLCYKECDYKALKKTVEYIESEISGCMYTKNPKKCYRRLYKVLLRIKSRLVEAEIDYRTELKHYKLSQYKNQN